MIIHKALLYSATNDPDYALLASEVEALQGLHHIFAHHGQVTVTREFEEN